MVVPTARRRGEEWCYHLQAAGGIVADSVTEDEYMETVNKSAALARAIDAAERAFL
jgi:anthranilate/para-aminobenzoate synthase component I